MHLAENSSDRHDVLGIGNAIVDMLAYAEDDLVEELGLARGAMTLIDAERSEFLYRRLGPAPRGLRRLVRQHHRGRRGAGRPRRLYRPGQGRPAGPRVRATTSAPPA